MLYGGYRGGPAYYIHAYVEEKQKKKRNKVVISVLFAISGLICWCGISQVISNSVVSFFLLFFFHIGMDIVCRPATITAIQWIFFFIELLPSLYLTVCSPSQNLPLFLQRNTDMLSPCPRHI